MVVFGAGFGVVQNASLAMLLERVADPDLPPEVRTLTGTLIPGMSARLG